MNTKRNDFSILTWRISETNTSRIWNDLDLKMMRLQSCWTNMMKRCIEWKKWWKQMLNFKKKSWKNVLTRKRNQRMLENKSFWSWQISKEQLETSIKIKLMRLNSESCKSQMMLMIFLQERKTRVRRKLRRKFKTRWLRSKITSIRSWKLQVELRSKDFLENMKRNWLSSQKNANETDRNWSRSWRKDSKIERRKRWAMCAKNLMT